MNSRLNREDLLEEESIDLSELLKAILKYCKLIGLTSNLVTLL